MVKWLESILVAINGSEASISALKYAIAVGKLQGSRIAACYVVDTATIRQLALSRIFIPEESEEYERSLEMSGKRYLGLCAELARQKGVEIQLLLKKGSVPGEIIKAAMELNAEIIFLGGNPQEPQYRDVIAEANREILKNARCSVLVVKPQAGDEIYKKLP